MGTHGMRTWKIRLHGRTRKGASVATGICASIATREIVLPLPRGKYRLRCHVSELDAVVLRLLALRTSNRVPAVSSTSGVALANASCTHAPHVRITVERTGAPALFERPARTFVWKC